MDLEKCLHSGQYFQWEKTPQGFALVSGNHAWHLEETEETWIVEGSNLEALIHLLDLESSYKDIWELLAGEKELAPVLRYGQGLRLMKQEAWDAILAFILSTNNNVGRIQKSIHSLSKEFGNKLLEHKGKIYYSLPSPEVLASIPVKEIREKVGAGYRDKYLVNTAKLICDGKVDLEGIRDLPYKNALEEIMKLSGVGKKAGDCILLFAYGFSKSFPVDVWMERIMQEFYGPFQSREEISEFGMGKFGQYAGFVQQLLFHYIRTNKKR